MRFMQIPVRNEWQLTPAPYMTAYLLDTPAGNPYFQTRPAVIICPGGAYCYVSPREGEAVAMRFLAAGFHAFILQYSVAPARFPTALTELADAVKTVRENAAEWQITPGKLFILGFSAGGHLCGSLGTLWNHPVLEEAFGYTGGAKPWKPDGMLLSYPVLTMGAHTHQGSLHNLLGEQPDAQLVSLLSLETQVSGDTVPAFLWHTADDGAVPVENSLQFATALRKAGVSLELHVFQHGPHGLSLCDKTTAYEPAHLVPDAAGWIDLAIAWVNRQ